jgi:hypothetical protein
MWNEAVVARFMVMLWNIPSGIKKKHDSQSRSRCPKRDSKREFPEYLSEPLPPEPSCSVLGH